MEFGKRMVVEWDLDKSQGGAPFDAIFDESGNFLLYSTMLGIKVLNLLTNKVSAYLGTSESLRFTGLALLQPSSDSVKGLELAASEHTTERKFDEPLLALIALKKNRFYLIGRSEPDSHIERDVMNEKPTKEDLATKVKAKAVLPTQAIIRTTLGDIAIKLMPDVAPLAVENFVTHSKNGYYDNLIFHRIIKGFMVQTGDPFGDGTGGESIWGADFRDEIQQDVKHDQPFTVSMANAGPGTNGSQFFITTVKCPWLDGKHTIFGRVVRGSEVVSKIEAADTDDLDKPKSDIKIIQIDTQA
jgi:peptidylprolyl isomerase domain and WD repeat-containing protein 1